MKPGEFMPTYDRDYSVIEIKQMIALSETKNHPYNGATSGHAFRDHHGISDADLATKNKSAFIIGYDMSYYVDTLDPAQIGQKTKIRIKTISDQPFMVATILNSHFGQQALKLLNVGINARMTIHANPMMAPMRQQMKMRVATPTGAVDSSGNVQHVVLVLDNNGWHNGKPYLHFVTAYPTNSAQYKFKFGPQVPRTRAGVEFYTHNNTRKSLHLWTSNNQNTDARLQLIHMA